MADRAKIGPVLLAGFAAGVAALVAQTLLVREELLLYGGNEIALGAFFGAWLLGVVGGAVLSKRWPGRWLPALLVLQGSLPIAATLMARWSRAVANVPAYEPFPLLSLVVWSLPVAIPVAVCTGALIPALARRAREATRGVTLIYVAESLGSVVGGVGTSLALVAGVEPATLLLVCPVIGVAGAVTVAQRRWPLALAGGALAIVAVVGGPTIGRQLRERHLQNVLPGAELVASAETASASLMAAELGGTRVLLADGRILAAFPDPARVERDAGLLAAATGAPERLLIIGDEGIDILPGALALGSLRAIIWVVADPGLGEFVLAQLPALAADPRLTIITGDPVRRLDELRAAGPFDAVWLLVDTPLRLADDRFIARETIADLSTLLAPDGVLAVPVSGAANYLGPRLRAALGCVVSGVAASLPDVRLLPGEQGYVLGARTSGVIDLVPEHLEQSYLAMAPATPRLDRDLFASLLEPRRVAAADQTVASLLRDPTVGPSSRDRPLALFHNLLVRAEQESTVAARLLERARQSGGLLWVPALVLALFALGRVASRVQSSDATRGCALLVLAAGGALGMGLDLVLLHLYQGRFGTLYLEIGWLFGLWMGGLAAGGLLGRRLCARGAIFGSGAAALGALMALAGAASLLGVALLPGRITGASAFVLAGGLTGVLVPVAEAMLAKVGILGAEAGANIEAADHLGGAVGALVLGLLGIPILGVSGAGLWLAGVALFGLGALALGGWRQRGELPAGLTAWLARLNVYQSFPFRRLLFVLLAVSSAAVVGSAVVRGVLLKPQRSLSMANLDLPELIPPWRAVRAPVLHYRSLDDGLALASHSAAPEVRGYGGPLNLLIAAGDDGRIIHLGVLAHDETPSYVEGIDRFLGTLAGMSVLEPIRVDTGDQGEETGQRVDGITGATVTSRAILAAINQSGARLAAPVFGRAPVVEARPNDLEDPRYWYLLGSLLLVIPVYWRGGRRLRQLWLVAHALVGGLWLGVQLSTVQVISWLRLDLNSDYMTWTGLWVWVGVSAILCGPIYCGYLCPAGAAQELLSLIGRAGRLPSEIDRPARFIKYVILAMLVIAVFGFGGEAASNVDLLRQVWAEQRSTLGLILLGLVGIGSLVVVRFGCRYLCPTGAFLGLLSRLTLLRRWLPAKKYGQCDLGVRGARDIDCIQCHRCTLGQSAQPAAGGRRGAFFALLAANLILLTVLAWPGGGPESSVGDALVRPVDPQLIKERIRGGRLSGKRAEYWHVVEP